MTPNQRYVAQMRAQGLVPCTVWVPSAQTRALQLYAAALRDDVTKPAVMQPKPKEKQK